MICKCKNQAILRNIDRILGAKQVGEKHTCSYCGGKIKKDASYYGGKNEKMH